MTDFESIEVLEHELEELDERAEKTDEEITRLKTEAAEVVKKAELVERRLAVAAG